jgi:hypothetical protein
MVAGLTVHYVHQDWQHRVAVASVGANVDVALQRHSQQPHRVAASIHSSLHAPVSTCTRRVSWLVTVAIKVGREV